MKAIFAELEREAAHADSMAAMAQFWMRRSQDAELTIAILVHAAGGEIVVHSGHVETARDLVLTKCCRFDDMTTLFRTATR